MKALSTLRLFLWFLNLLGAFREGHPPTRRRPNSTDFSNATS